MTVANTNTRQTWNGTGAQHSFPFTDISYYLNTDFTVIYRNTLGVETTLVLNTDYTITPSGLTLPFTAGTLDLIGDWVPHPPASGTKIVLIRAIAYTQQIDLATGGDMPANTIEEGFDRGVMLVQQIKELIARSLTLPISSTYSGLSIPDPLALRFLRWNAAATALENATIADASVLTVYKLSSEITSFNPGEIKTITIATGITLSVTDMMSINIDNFSVDDSVSCLNWYISGNSVVTRVQNNSASSQSLKINVFILKEVVV
jgi:hypothetical protein